MTPVEREAWLRDVITKVSGADADKVARTEDLHSAVGLDSLGRLEVLAEIEDKFDLFLDDGEMIGTTTIERMLQSIDRHQSSFLREED